MILETIFALFFIASLFFIIPFILMMEFFLFFVTLGFGALVGIAMFIGWEWAIQIVLLIYCLALIHYFRKWWQNKKKI